MIEEFIDTSPKNGHRAFQKWRQTHPEGFCLNHLQGETYLLHAAQCRHFGNTVWGRDSGHSLTRSRKVCGTYSAELEVWAVTRGFSVKACQDCAPRRAATEFVAYHSSRLMGEEYWPETQFHFFSRKSERFLHQAIGSRIWLIVSASRPNRLSYYLAGVYTGAEINPEGKGFGITGQGTPFRPPFEINSLPWFRELLQEQGNFSFGFNALRSNRVIGGLRRLLSELGGRPVLQADEVLDARPFIEGAVQRVFVNRYERDPFAREQCIARHGCRCEACGFDFEKAYGELGRGFIHVHHLKPLSEIKGKHAVDPVADLRPVCANCHAMIHRSVEMLTIKELKERLQRAEC